MKRVFAIFALALLVSGAQAATTATTLTVNATANVGATGVTATGTANLTNIGSGTFAGTLPLTSLGGASATATFTITLSGGAGTLTGTLSVPTALLLGTSTSGSGSATITGGTGSFAGATGSFPTLPGTATGSIITGFTLSFSGAGSITTSGGPTTPVPTITDVLDAGSYTANVAQGSIFVVKGSTLSASGFTQLSFPLPTSSNGVKITFTPTAGGAGIDAFLVYLYNLSGVNQLAAILPSTAPVGNYNVTVTNGTASAPFPVTVVQRKIGLITQDGTGTGLSVLQNYISATQLDVDRLTTGTVSGITISPAKPGQVLIAWATGMGPVTGGDNTASPGFNFAANGVTVRILVGGTSITPDYAGRAPGLAGADQINFTLPANVPTGCSVTFQVSVNGVLSNPTTIAIAPNAGASACVQPGYTTQQLQSFDQGGSYTTGVFYLTQLSLTVPTFGTVKSNAAGGSIVKVTGFQLASAPSQSQISTSGDCLVTHTVTSGTTQAVGAVTVTGLDAGTVTLNGPAGSNITNLAFKQDPKYNTYSLALATEGISIPGQSNATITAGTYALAAAGGKDVKSFNSSLTLGTPISITGGLPATVNRASGLTLNWTGGNASDIVQIVGGAAVVTGTGANASTDSTSFICTTTAGRGTFTVPSSILLQLPAVVAGATNGGGILQVASVPNPSTFAADLTAGGKLDAGLFLAFVGTANTPAYQ